jgi:hypothetical protein|tara:strand:+ start:2366 stop:2776 length:411 start_codon:yes stop_codon:yes gene_type:complete
MKKMLLKSVQMPVDHLRPEGETITLDYRDEIMRLLQVPAVPDKGAQYKEMMEVMPVYGKFKNFEMPDVGHGIIELENAEFKLVATRLKNAKFTGNTFEIFDMIRTCTKNYSHPQEGATADDEDDDEVEAEDLRETG